MASTTTTAQPADISIPDAALSRPISLKDLDPEAQSPDRDVSDKSFEPSEGSPVFDRLTPVSEIKMKVIAANLAVMLAGFNDAAPGALIPTLQAHYHIGTGTVALTFLANFVGFMSAALVNLHLTARFGTGGMFVIGAAIQASAYAFLCWAPPYPLYVCAFFLSGLGVALQDAQANVYIANVADAHRWLGILHAVYGLGAIFAPLIATAMATKTPYWHFVYLILLGMELGILALLVYAFRENLFKPDNEGEKEAADGNFIRTLKSPLVWLMSGFFFLYVGTEVTAGGWIVEFLIRVRGGKQSKVGYVASGFWTGLTLGRVLLADVTHKLGERLMISIYLVLALSHELVVWFVPHIIPDAVMISLFGFWIGTFFPSGISVAARLLPRELHVSAMGFMSTIGQAGSAAFPFMTGAIAAKKGVTVLQPMLVGLLVGQGVLWVMVPRMPKKSAQSSQ